MAVRIDVLRLCFCLFVVIALLCGSGCGMVSTKEEQQMEERVTMNELERKLMEANWGEEIESEENLYDYQREQLDQLRAAIQYLEDKYPGHELELYSFAPETTLTERGTLCFRSESGREHQLVLHVEENGYSCADTYYGELIEPAYDAALKEVIQDECGIDLLVLTTFAMPVGMEVNGETTVRELLALGSQLERKTHLFMQHPENKEETSAQLQKALNDAGFCGSYFVFFVDETDWGQIVLQLDQKRGTFERSYFTCNGGK